MYIIKQCPQYELRTLIFSLLNGNVLAIDNSVVPVFEAVPRELPRPYIAIGRATWTPDEQKSYTIDMYVLEVDIFTDYGGTLENVFILNGVQMALSNALNTKTLQFPDDSKFRIGMMYFEGGSTEVIGNDALFPELLEKSTFTMSFMIEQTRG
jgi:hypothetical protein